MNETILAVNTWNGMHCACGFTYHGDVEAHLACALARRAGHLGCILCKSLGIFHGALVCIIRSKGGGIHVGKEGTEGTEQYDVTTIFPKHDETRFNFFKNQCRIVPIRK